jgi:hypothetical protein
MKPNDILAAILREVRKDIDPIPEGYMSMKDFMKAWRLPRSTVQGHIDAGLAKGILHRIRLRQLGAKGKKVHTFFYKSGPAPSCRKPKAKV